MKELKTEIPDTSDEKCIQYRTTCTFCKCPDFDPDKREGGSYVYRNVRMCKHIYHQIKRAYRIFEANETILIHPSSGHNWCYCEELVTNNFDGCSHLSLLKKLEEMFKQAERKHLAELIEANKSREAKPPVTDESFEAAVNSLYGEVE